MVLAGHCIFLDNDGDYARFENRKDAQLDFMLIEGEPTNEKIHRGVRTDFGLCRACARTVEIFPALFFPLYVLIASRFKALRLVEAVCLFPSYSAVRCGSLRVM